MSRAKTIILLVFLSLAGAFKGSAAEVEDVLPVILEQRISTDRTYPQQPVDLSVDLYVEEAPDNTSALDPFIRAVLHQKERFPVLFLSWAHEQELPSELRPLESHELWIETLPQKQYGFAIFGLKRRTDFSSNLYYPYPERVQRKAADGTERQYWKYTVQRRYIPTAPGEYTFPPARFLGIVLGTTADSNGKPVTQPFNVSVKSEPVQLTVLDVPRENRPENDVGLFGVFDWEVDITPKTAKVGEPLTLTILFHGIGSIVHSKAPDLSENVLVAENFKTYPATEDVFDDIYRYTYTIRPNKSGLIVFPELVVSYFNVQQERFTELKSSPITLTIQPVEQVDQSSFTSGRNPLKPKRNEPILTESGIFGNFTDLDGAKNQRTTPGFYLTVLSVLWGIYCLLAIALFFARIRRPYDPERPRLAAIALARERMAGLQELLDDDKPHQACVQIRNILVDFIAEVSHGTARGITPDEAVEIVRKWNLHETQIEELGDLFDHLDAIRFGSLAPQKAAKSVERGSEILEDLIAALPPLKREDTVSFRTGTIPTALSMLFVLLSLPGCGATFDPENDFQEATLAFEKAVELSVPQPGQVVQPLAEETTIAKREAQNEFRRVAAMYQGLIDRGIESGAILYNQGNAWSRAGEPSLAILSYRKAQRYWPRDPYLLANLKTVAISISPAEKNGVLPALLFWQNSVSYPLKLHLAFFISLLAFAVAILALFRREKSLTKIAWIFVALMLLAIASAAYDWHRFDRTEYGVVIAEQTIPRKGNSTQYEPAFTDPVLQRTEFTVRDKRGQWIRAEFPGGETGWIPTEEVAIY